MFQSSKISIITLIRKFSDNKFLKHQIFARADVSFHAEDYKPIIEQQILVFLISIISISLSRYGYRCSPRRSKIDRRERLRVRKATSLRKEKERDERITQNQEYFVTRIITLHRQKRRREKCLEWQMIIAIAGARRERSRYVEFRKRPIDDLVQRKRSSWTVNIIQCLIHMDEQPRDR